MNNNITIVDDDISNSSTYRKDYCDDITSKNVPVKLEEIEIQIDRLKYKWNEFTYLIGQRLKVIKDNKLYEEKKYPDFKTYVNIALKMSVNNAYYYIAIFEYFTEEQTVTAGSKLKLIIPMLNKLKNDKSIPEEFKENRIKILRDEMYFKIYQNSYREAEEKIKQIKNNYFTSLDNITNYQKVIEKKDKIIINEEDPEIRKELISLINAFYSGI